MKTTSRLPDLDAIDAAADAGQVLSAAAIKELTRLIRQLAGLPLPDARDHVAGQLGLFDEGNQS